MQAATSPPVRANVVAAGQHSPMFIRDWRRFAIATRAAFDDKLRRINNKGLPPAHVVDALCIRGHTAPCIRLGATTAPMGHIAQARARVAAQTALNKIVTSIRRAGQSHGHSVMSCYSLLQEVQQHCLDMGRFARHQDRR